MPDIPKVKYSDVGWVACFLATQRSLHGHVGLRKAGNPTYSAMVIPENVALYAIRKGLYVIGQNGDHLALRNHSVFVPKAW